LPVQAGPASDGITYSDIIQLDTTQQTSPAEEGTDLSDPTHPMGLLIVVLVGVGILLFPVYADKIFPGLSDRMVVPGPKFPPGTSR
ncbi:MAG: hypothetical protein AAFR61_21570, partial [Bacteroidota bacterium]